MGYNCVLILWQCFSCVYQGKNHFYRFLCKLDPEEYFTIEICMLGRIVLELLVILVDWISTLVHEKNFPFNVSLNILKIPYQFLLFIKTKNAWLREPS